MKYGKILMQYKLNKERVAQNNQIIKIGLNKISKICMDMNSKFHGIPVEKHLFTRL